MHAHTELTLTRTLFADILLGPLSLLFCTLSLALLPRGATGEAERGRAECDRISPGLNLPYANLTTSATHGTERNFGSVIWLLCMSGISIT